MDKKKMMVAAGVVLFFGAVQAETLVDYGFAAGIKQADDVAAGVKASRMTWDTGAIAPEDGRTSADGLPQWKKYGTAATVQFSVSPAAGKKIDFQSLSFELQMDTAKTKQRKLEVTSSATGDKVLFTAYNYHYGSDEWITDDRRQQQDFVLRNIDLSQLPELQGAAGEVTFTLKFSGPGADAGNMRLDSIKVDGIVK